MPGETYGKTVSGAYVPDPHLTDEQYETGVSLHEKRFGQPPVVFALFAFEGTENVEAIRGWLTASTISVVCCLSAGCVAVNDTALGEEPSPDATTVAHADDSLWHFSEVIGRAAARHRVRLLNFDPDFSGYAAYQTGTRGGPSDAR